MNERLQAFQDFLSIQSIQIPLLGFLWDLVLAAVLSSVLARVYVRYGTSLSNREMLAKQFVLLAMTTALVITVVKSSLALSLGLVGALSIVRFRAAIKEPEELIYLFLNIAIGLGFGASQRLVTTVAFGLIVIVIIFQHNMRIEQAHNLFLNVSTQKSASISLEQITDIVKAYSRLVNLRRFDEQERGMDVSFCIEITEMNQLQMLKNEILKNSPDAHITFLDNKGIS